MVMSVFLVFFLLAGSNSFSVFPHLNSFSNHPFKGIRSYQHHASSIDAVVTLKNEWTDRIRLFDSVTRRKESFRPAGPRVKIYGCGPTVYDFAHIGNMRTFVFYDLLHRWLRYSGFEVDFVCNLTDIDDKILAKLHQGGQSLQVLTDHYADSFFQDLKTLNVINASLYPRVSHHIPEIIQFIEELLAKGLAYCKQGSVYFNSTSFSSVTKLKASSPQNSSHLETTDDLETRMHGLRSEDFVLWKGGAAVMSWDASFGRGRPGWHIECSAMCRASLGPTVDIHVGGIDLLFPHHQNEITQSEAANGAPLARHWMHAGFVLMEGEKMSKSLNNFLTVRDVALSREDAMALRFLYLSSLYRKPLTYSSTAMIGAINSMSRITSVLRKLRVICSNQSNSLSTVDGQPRTDFSAKVVDALRSFNEALCDDLNTPRAISSLFSIVGLCEPFLPSAHSDTVTMALSEAALALRAVEEMDKVLGLLPQDEPSTDCNARARAPILDPEVDWSWAHDLARQRADLKATKRFAEADELRCLLRARGVTLVDRKDGTYHLADKDGHISISGEEEKKSQKTNKEIKFTLRQKTAAITTQP